MTTVLFATSEVYPLIKTGGLADVSRSLPAALHALGHDIRLIIPAYPQVLARCQRPILIQLITIPGVSTPVRLFEGWMPGDQVPIYLVDCPIYFDRLGGPYGTEQGDWSDNPQRFALFARVVVALATGQTGLDWIPSVVHCNDWQTGLIPALLSLETYRPATIFTIHNLSYQGLFPWGTFVDLNLPMALWSPDGLEFYHQMSFIKGGLAYADLLTVVSPTYAQEIRTPTFGYGLAGLLEKRADQLVGILNGVDYTDWDPRHDTAIPHRYDDMSGKAANKAALQRRLGLPVRPDVMLMGFIGRLVEQKGFDLILCVIPGLIHRPVQVVILGSGNTAFEQGARDLAIRFSTQVAVRIGYDEDLAHLIEAGADVFLMPSRFEPCGLNQLYSLRYGTLPIVRRTGGLADTIVDATPDALMRGQATGFVFEAPIHEAFNAAILRAFSFYHQDSHTWEKMVKTAMAADHSWTQRARQYAALYVSGVSLLKKH